MDRWFEGLSDQAGTVFSDIAVEVKSDPFVILLSAGFCPFPVLEKIEIREEGIRLKPLFDLCDHRFRTKRKQLPVDRGAADHIDVFLRKRPVFVGEKIQQLFNVMDDVRTFTAEGGIP